MTTLPPTDVFRDPVQVAGAPVGSASVTIVVALGINAPVVVPDYASEADQLSMLEWLTVHPELGALLANAINLAKGTAA
jgi:hypothetical protein